MFGCMFRQLSLEEIYLMQTAEKDGWIHGSSGRYSKFKSFFAKKNSTRFFGSTCRSQVTI
jgi:hypothetical protein